MGRNSNWHIDHSFIAWRWQRKISKILENHKLICIDKQLIKTNQTHISEKNNCRRLKVYNFQKSYNKFGIFHVLVFLSRIILLKRVFSFSNIKLYFIEVFQHQPNIRKKLFPWKKYDSEESISPNLQFRLSMLKQE